MPEQSTEIRDKQTICVERFEAGVRAELKRLITDALIEEHRVTHGRRRSDALEHELSFFRRAGAAD
jgi:hypothetical protein